jgi:hypothetical protein
VEATSPKKAPRSKVDSAKPQTLLSLPVSAYHAGVALTDGAVVVTTPGRVYRLDAEAREATLSPPEDSPVAVEGGSLVYWSAGGFWRQSFGGDPNRIGDGSERPIALAASADAFAWLERSAVGAFTIKTLRGSETLTLYSSPTPISALTMEQDVVLFIEAMGPSAWRLGRVSVDGGKARLSPAKASRPPAMLGSYRDQVYYYGGLKWGLRAASVDLGDERTIAKGVVCSPLAAAEHLYCAQVRGLAQLSETGEVLRWITENHGRLITAVAADSKRVVWIGEAGETSLQVEMLALD